MIYELSVGSVLVSKEIKAVLSTHRSEMIQHGRWKEDC